MVKRFLVLPLGLIFSCLQAQVQPIKLDSVVVEATRLSSNKKETPASITVKSFVLQSENMQQLTLNTYLQGVPGLFIQNSNNFAQDSRISIRGFGSRSAFGIRGVKLLVDGIPETTPDGQGQIDNLGLGLIQNIEVLRGASSALYGNASGGVINISTLGNFEKDFLTISSGIGSFGFQNYQALGGFENDKLETVLFLNRTVSDGYREHSKFETNQFNLKSRWLVSKTSNLTFQLNYTDSPIAEDAGGITAENVANDRRQARDRNVEFNSSEAVNQFKTGLAFQMQKFGFEFNSFGYYSYRDFENFLPFENGGAVDLVRNYWGHGSNLSFYPLKKKESLTFQVGYELASQNDRRTRYNNLMGNRGEVSLQQNEIFQNFGAFILAKSQLESFNFSVGLRFDANKLKAEDDFLLDGNASDKLNLNTLNPSFGVRYALTKTHSLFSNFSTSFETPVLSELSANPTNQGGFNQNLSEQTATNFEFGYSYVNSKFAFDATLFSIETKGDIIPFELEDFPERTFYRNAGETKRIGLELENTVYLTPKLKLNTSYTWSNFTYEEYELPSGSFDNNKLPGIPEHLFNVQGTYSTNTNFIVIVNTQYRGSFYTNDANTVEEGNVVLLNTNISKSFTFSTIKLKPYLGVNNFLDQKYSDNIRINAFGGRYFEPAAGINFYGGLRLLF